MITNATITLAQKVLMIRWNLQAKRLESAMATENPFEQNRILAALISIEEEAVENGWHDMLSIDGAVATEMKHIVPIKVATGGPGRACVIGWYGRGSYPLVGLPKKSLKQDVVDDEPQPRIMVRVDLRPKEEYTMALPKRETVVTPQLAEGVAGATPLGLRPPISQVGATAGQPLSQRPIPVSKPLTGAARRVVTPEIASDGTIRTVSKAEQLRAMKKAAVGAAVANGTTKSAAAKSLVPKASVPKVQTLCLDGCGQLVNGRFAMGHDAKLKSTLIKIERGDLDVSSVPEIARPFVEFGAGVPSEEADAQGNRVTVLYFPILKAPVRFPGRDDVEYVQKLGDGWGGK